MEVQPVKKHLKGFAKASILLLTLAELATGGPGNSVTMIANVLRGRSDLTLVNNGASIQLPRSPTTLASQNLPETLTSKNIDATNNTITNITNTEIKALAAIARSKIAPGAVYHVVVNDGSGYPVAQVGPFGASYILMGTGVGGSIAAVPFPTSSGTGTVTSVDVAVPTGFGSTGGPVTTSGTITLTAPQQSYEASNVGLSVTVSSNTLIVALKQKDGSTNCSTGSSACLFAVGSSTVNGKFTQFSQTAALSITAPAGATLGSSDGYKSIEYVYLADTNGLGTNNKICLASILKNQDGLHTSVAMGTGADLLDKLYCDAVYSAKINLIGAIESTQTTAGTWATAPSAVKLKGRFSETSTPFLHYIPSVLAGFGSTSAIEAQWKQNTDSIDILALFTTGTNTGTQAQFELPGDITGGTLTTLQMVGYGVNRHVGDCGLVPSISSGAFSVTFGADCDTFARSGQLNGNSGAWSDTEDFTFFARIPIANY